MIAWYTSTINYNPQETVRVRGGRVGWSGGGAGIGAEALNSLRDSTFTFCMCARGVRSQAKGATMISLGSPDGLEHAPKD